MKTYPNLPMAVYETTAEIGDILAEKDFNISANLTILSGLYAWVETTAEEAGLSEEQLQKNRMAFFNAVDTQRKSLNL